MIKAEIDMSQADALFRELIARSTNLRPLMQDLGEYLSETTKQRFETSIAPDGSRWKPNAPATYLAYLGAFKSSFGKGGKITKAGAGRASGKKPLVGETRRLGGEIAYQADASSVEIGSSLVYSAIHQFGGQAGRGKATTIPARPYLGLSADDQAFIVERAAAYLTD